jgi:hypothetical protein
VSPLRPYVFNSLLQNSNSSTFRKICTPDSEELERIHSEWNSIVCKRLKREGESEREEGGGGQDGDVASTCAKPGSCGSQVINYLAFDTVVLPFR